MLSSVLRSQRAVGVNIAIMRTFVQLRRLAFLPVLAYDGANMTQIDAGASLTLRWRAHLQRCWPASGRARCW